MFSGPNSITIGIIMSKSTIFIHGNSGSMEDWRLVSDHLEDSTESRSMQVLGCSGRKSHIYDMKTICADIIEQIKKTSLNEFILVGHSLGGHIVHEICDSEYIRDRCSGVLTFGAPPLTLQNFGLAPFLENLNSSIFSSELIEEDTLRAVYFENFTGNSLTYEAFKASFESADGLFRSNLFASVMRGEFRDEVTALNSFEKPVVFALCNEDPYINQEYIAEASKRIPLSKTITLSSVANHYPHFEKAEEIAKIISSMLLTDEYQEKGKVQYETGHA